MKRTKIPVIFQAIFAANDFNHEIIPADSTGSFLCSVWQ